MTRMAVVLTLMGCVSVQGEESLRDFVKRVQRRTSYAMYVKGRKAGWLIEELRLGQHQGREVALQIDESDILMSAGGNRSHSTSKTVTAYDLAGKGEMLFAEETSVENGVKTVTKVERGKKNDLVITRTTQGRTSKRTIPMIRDTLALRQKFDVWLKGQRKAGDTVDDYEIDWSQDKVEFLNRVAYQKKKTILASGVKKTIHQAEVSVFGARLQAQITSTGAWYTARLGSLIEIRTEPEAIAKKRGKVLPDISSEASIIVDRDLGHPRKVDHLTILLSGQGDLELESTPRQKVTKQGKDLKIELRRDFLIEGKGQALGKDEKEKYLESTANIQANDKSIQEIAKKIVGKETDLMKQFQKLQFWLYVNLKKSLIHNTDSALTVLKNKAGDCTEHALLFVALARSLGIPARQVTGVMFGNSDNKSMFLWHAWAEAHNGKQWVTVDPAWNEVLVDATHIKFGQGSRDLAWISVASQLKIKIESFKAR